MSDRKAEAEYVAALTIGNAKVLNSVLADDFVLIDVVDGSEVPKEALLTLVSHYLCPYVQRAIIVASEKGIDLNRTMIDLAAKPDWFLVLSPTGKVPLLRVRTDGAEHVLFESAAICEYLDETGPVPRLVPEDPIARAKDRAWVEFASGTLADIAGLYSAPDRETFEIKTDVLRRRFAQLEQAVALPWFAGERFGFVDAAFGPVFRYLDALERLVDLSLVSDLASVASWRRNLADRPSIRLAIGPNYVTHLEAFLRARKSYLGHLLFSRIVHVQHEGSSLAFLSAE